MRICIPTNDARGLASAMSVHFGRARYFALADTEDGSVELIGNERACQGGGRCDSAEVLRNRRVDAVVCAGIGAGALARLQALGVRVVATEAEDVAGALAALRAGRVRPFDLASACREEPRPGSTSASTRSPLRGGGARPGGEA